MKPPRFADHEHELTARSRSLQEHYEARQRPSTPYELLSGAWCAGELAVRRVRGVEAMSSCFRFDVEVHTAIDPTTLRAALLGRPATLLMHSPGRAPSPVHGVVGSLRAVGALPGASTRSWVWRVRLVPRAWLLRHRTNSRIYQDRSSVEVVTALLDEHRVAHRASLTQRHRVHAYCVQYEESDLDFVTRQLATAGVAYWFEPPSMLVEMLERGVSLDAATHAQAVADGEVMVLADSAQAYGALSRTGEPSPTRSASLVVRDAPDENLDDDAVVTSFESTRRIRSKSVTLREYDFKRPFADVSAYAALPTEEGLREARGSLTGLSSARLLPLLGEVYPPVAPEHLEHYAHHGEYEEAEAGSAQSALRAMEQLRARALVAEGRSLCRGLRPGLRFTLEEHAVDGCNREHVVVRIEHRGVTPANVPTERDAARVYENHFECLPSEVIDRPKMPPRRVQQVTEVATVVGAPGEDIHTDAFGRIKVQFPWDRHGQRDDRSSCWIRVSQSWAGSSWGAQFIPRVGMEVLVTFLGGDVDRPVVVGALYNGANGAPFSLPGHRTRSGWRSNSSPGGGGYNELSFEDLAGHEQVLLRAQRDLDVEAGRDHTRTVRHDELVVIHNHQHLTVFGDRRVMVHGVDEHTSTSGRRALVRGDDALVVEGHARTTAHGDLSVRVVGASRWDLGKTAEVEAEGDAVLRVLGDAVMTVGTHAAPTTWLAHAEGSARVESTALTEISSDREVLLRCGTTLLRLTPDRLEIRADAVEVTGGDAALTAEDGDLRVRARGAFQTVTERVVMKTDGASLGLTTDAMLDGARVLLRSPSSATDPAVAKRVEPTRIELCDQDDRAIAHARYVIHLDGGGTRAGVLDENGRAEIELQGSGTIEFPELRGVERR